LDSVEVASVPPPASPLPPPAGRSFPLVWRVFVANAAVLLVAGLALALSPATVSRPVLPSEAAVLIGGLVLMLVLDLVLVRRALSPLARLTRVMRRVDPLAPGERLPAVARDAETVELAHAFNDMLDRLERERRESARQALGAQEAERRRVARELHDEVGQGLTALVLGLEQATRRAPPELAEQLAGLREAARAGLEEVRDVARRLRPEALDELGLASALAALTTGLSRQTGLRVERRVEPSLPALGEDVELVIYRVAQESLTNVARHAGARRVELTLERRDGAVVLSVTDDGRGIARGAPHSGGTGIRSMRERALLVGGRLSIVRRGEGGTRVRLELPVDGAER
jgi:two-component system, NarL family, sensor histidine kinase UhpB